METKTAVTVLSALAQDTRIDVFRLLVRAGCDGLPAGAIAEHLGIPAPTLSFHLKELRSAGIVEAERSGRTIVYRADFVAMRRLVAYLTEECCGGVEGSTCAPTSLTTSGGTR